MSTQDEEERRRQQELDRGAAPGADPTTAGERAEQIDDEIAEKYDPERLLGMVSKRAGRGQTLDQSIRAKYEKRFGVDLGHVRIYTGEFAEEFNRQRSAYAVTIGSTGMILMGGSPDRAMSSSAGQALLAHELTHVAQQSKGLHRKGTFSGAMQFAKEHEHEAERVEAEARQEAQGLVKSGKAALDEMSHKQRSDKERAAKIEAIKERVEQMFEDSFHHQAHRNGSRRSH